MPLVAKGRGVCSFGRKTPAVIHGAGKLVLPCCLPQIEACLLGEGFLDLCSCGEERGEEGGMEEEDVFEFEAAG